ncbi:flagella basal body P-ring formation protein FlgA [Paracoccus isoporae]|uniref:Flagella basal body P-ring formation protein FlgA n=1 Tax=Paracoccus isoporae TaxID=591205 RepID=A0A1G7CVZ4_9RHOB|nr:flagellar basal body P-ring formation chaperone FlgA [Paracoccus isoporae]SDE43522.1 flagella basal body P-ring formation protein FlgA [Paracoccus isoporae]
MRAWLIMVLAAFAPVSATAGMVAARNLPAGTLIAAEDLLADEMATEGVAEAAAAIGRQTRIAIYAGRPVAAGALRDPVLVARNQDVRLIFSTGGLQIETAGRALAEGSAGEWVRAMNLSSRNTVTARIAPDGALIVPSHQEGADP